MFIFFNEFLNGLLQTLNNNSNNNMAKKNNVHCGHTHNNITRTGAVKTKKVKKEFISKVPLMEPDINFILVPSTKDTIKIGTLVFAKIKGKYIQHKVAEIDHKKGYKLTRKGHCNGWIKNVFTKVENTKKVEKTETVTAIFLYPTIAKL